MDRHRLILGGLGLALVAVIVAALVLADTGRDTGLPIPLESVVPGPGSATIRQAVIEVDLAVGYDIELFVDGTMVPDTEITVQPQTGRFTWDPASSPSFGPWSPGDHVVRVEWHRRIGLPDVGSFEWTFRVQ